jgi:predicted component of type VI protein secretion system
MGALSEADGDELNGVLETLERARDAVAGIRVVCIEEAGFDQAPTLEKLPQAVEAMIALIESATGKSSGEDGATDGDAVDGGGAAPGATAMVVQLPAGAVANREEAVEALHAAAKYFALKEPSSPVPVLLREAQSATSKSFYELVNELVPDTASSAFVSLGQEPWFDVSFYTLDSRNPAPDYENDAPTAEEASSSWENAGLDDEMISDSDAVEDGISDEASNDAANDGVGNDGAESDALANDAAASDAVENDTVSNDDTANDAVAENDAANDVVAENDTINDAPTENDAIADEEVVDDTATEESAEEPEQAQEAVDAGPRFVANSRPEAVALMEKVLAYYRVAEPSSPVPLILERAIDLSSKSFIDLLKKVLPDGSLKVRPQEEEGGSSW